MSKNHRLIIKKLPGPISYCDCKKLCSRVEIDHVIPKSLLKRKTSRRFSSANRNMHNLHRCCHKVNNPKSAALIGLNYTTGLLIHDSYLARIALYMDEKYDLLDYKHIVKLKEISLTHKPFDYEIERNRIVTDIQGDNNDFITDFPDKILSYYD